MRLDPLPIDAHVDAVVNAVRRHRAAVVVAPPGAGKTTRVPPALAADGPVLVLQPRRVAARAIARRIAEERGWTLGQRGRLARALRAPVHGGDARLCSRPKASSPRDCQTIRCSPASARSCSTSSTSASIHADLGLALARQAWTARDDLRVVVMSATLDAEPVARFLDGCPIVEVPGRRIRSTSPTRPASRSPMRSRTVWPDSRGSVLCFLPGAPEIRRAARRGRRTRRRTRRSSPCTAGSAPTEQDRARLRCRSGGRRRVILATNIAETSLTVPGVDSRRGHRAAQGRPLRCGAGPRHARHRARVPGQRRPAGRPRRPSGPGARPPVVGRPRSAASPSASPTSRASIWPGRCSNLAWGADPEAFVWFEAPPAEAVAAARRLLQRLGALDGERADAARPADAGLAAAAAAGPHPDRGGRRPRRGAGLRASFRSASSARPAARRRRATSSARWTRGRRCRRTCTRSPAEIEDLARGSPPPRRDVSAFAEADLRRALFVGYADRLARRREAQRHDARAGDRDGRRPRPRERGPRRGVPGRARRPGADAPGRSERAGPCREPRRAGVDRADRHRRRARLRSAQRPGARLAAGARRSADSRGARAGARARRRGRGCWRRHGWRAGPDETNAGWIRRVRFAGLDVDLPALVRQAAGGVASLADDRSRRAGAVRDGARARSSRADAPGAAERAAHGAGLRAPTAPFRRPRSCRSCSGWPRRRASGRLARRWCCRCSRRMGGRCRPPVTCAASGIAPIRKSGASCAAGIRGTRGPRIRGPRRPPRGPSRARVPSSP